MKFTTALVSSFALLSGCSSATPQAPSGPDAGPAPTMNVGSSACPTGQPFQVRAGKVVIEVTINGVPRQMLLDTGAPTTVFDTSVKDAGPYLVETAGISLEFIFPEKTNLAAFGVPGIDGVLGMDFVGKRVLHVDYPRGVFWISETMDNEALLACTHLMRKPRVEPIVRRSYLFVHGSLEGEQGWLLVDSGATFGGVPESVFREMQSKHPRPVLSGFYTQAAIGTFWAKLVPIAHVGLGDERVPNFLARTLPDNAIQTPTFPDKGRFLGLLPSDFLSQYLVSIDVPNSTMRIDRGIDATQLAKWKVYAAGISLEDTLEPPFRIGAVLEGSDAKAQGLVAGDEVLAIGGTAIERIAPANRGWSLVGPDANAKVQVSIRRDGATKDYTLTLTDSLVAPTIP